MILLPSINLLLNCFKNIMIIAPVMKYQYHLCACFNNRSASRLICKKTFTMLLTVRLCKAFKSIDELWLLLLWNGKFEKFFCTSNCAFLQQASYKAIETASKLRFPHLGFSQ